MLVAFNSEQVTVVARACLAVRQARPSRQRGSCFIVSSSEMATAILYREQVRFRSSSSRYNFISFHSIKSPARLAGGPVCR